MLMSIHAIISRLRCRVIVRVGVNRFIVGDSRLGHPLVGIRLVYIRKARESVSAAILLNFVGIAISQQSARINAFW